MDSDIGELPADADDIGEIGDGVETPAEEGPDSQPGKEVPAKADDSESKKADESGTGDATPKEAPEGAQKRIAEVIAQRNKEREAGQKKDEIISAKDTELRAQRAILEALNIKPEEMPALPKLADYDDEDAFDTAMDGYRTMVARVTAKNVLAETVKEATQKVSVDEISVRRNNFSANLKGSFKTEEEFDQFATDANAVAGLGANGNENLQRAIWAAPHGVEILKYLTANPGEANRIATLDPVSIGMEIGNLSGRISAAPVPISNAPDPVTHLSGSSRESGGDATADSMKDIDADAIRLKF